MGFLLCLDPLMNSRRNEAYEPQRNEDINMVSKIHRVFFKLSMTLSKSKYPINLIVFFMIYHSISGI